jgi:hypothetical protein
MPLVLKPSLVIAFQVCEVKLRDFEYEIVLSRIYSWSSYSTTVHAVLVHPDGEEHHIYFYEHEPPGPGKAFWSVGGTNNTNYAELQEMQRFYHRIYATRLADMLKK